jgi:nicotinamide-nucleotide amidase
MDPNLVPAIAERLRHREEWLATAESCTGGLIARLLTDIAGSSQWFERGLVTYSNRAKTELLGVPEAAIQKYGAVSRECAEAMAAGLLLRAPIEWTLSVTGIAGPSGGSDDKPVGTVWIGVAHAGGAAAHHYHFQGDRSAIRLQAAEAALRQLLAHL